MNLEKVFNFIKQKRGYNYPIKYKLLNGLPLSDDELYVEGDLDLNFSKITSLPDNLHVNGYLYIYFSKIASIPDNLEVEGFLDIHNTPLSKNYRNREEEIRKMIEDKGGYVQSRIFA